MRALKKAPAGNLSRPRRPNPVGGCPLTAALMPRKDEIPVIRFEGHPDSPMRDLLSEEQQERLRRMLRE